MEEKPHKMSLKECVFLPIRRLCAIKVKCYIFYLSNLNSLFIGYLSSLPQYVNDIIKSSKPTLRKQPVVQHLDRNTHAIRRLKEKPKGNTIFLKRNK